MARERALCGCNAQLLNVTILWEILRGDIPGEKRLLEPSTDDEYVPGLIGEGLDWEQRGHGDLMWHVLRVSCLHTELRLEPALVGQSANP